VSNEYLDLVRVFAGPQFHPVTSSSPWTTAFIDWDAEVSGTSSQCAVWTTTDPAGSKATGGARLNRTLGPTVNWVTDTSGSDATRDVARYKAVVGLLNQLIASAQASKTFNVSGTTGNSVNPTVITTSTAHGLTTGWTGITVADVGGNTAANGVWTVTVLTPTTFSVPVAGNGSYTSGGKVVYAPNPMPVYPRDFGLV
jgi:hypothetical protein